MVKVHAHGDVYEVQNPLTKQWTRMINVIFVEEGRSGANKGLSDTSDFLSKVVGEKVGLDQIRTHTHPIKADHIGSFPIGTEMDGYINREMYSTPQMNNQVDKTPRSVNGRPTFFVTVISEKPEEDKDYRVDNDTLIRSGAVSMIFGNQTVGATNIRTITRRQENSNPQEQPENLQNADVLAGAMAGQQG